MRRITYLVFLVTFNVLTLLGCSSQPTYHLDWQEDFDFRSLQTYRWYDDQHPSKLADYRQYNSSDRRVRTYIGRELQLNGYRQIASGEPDFLVNYHISREEKMHIDSFAGYPSGGMHGSAGVGTYGSAVSVGYSSGPSVKTWEEGTVVIDVIDTARDKIVWRSIAEGRLPQSLSHDEKDALASKLARELMAEFPPPRGREPPLHSSCSPATGPRLHGIRRLERSPQRQWLSSYPSRGKCTWSVPSFSVLRAST